MSFKKGHRSFQGRMEKNSNWSGDDVSYEGLHGWVRLNKEKPDLCERCGKVPPYDLANISQEYKRDINDFEWLCRRCHMEKDGRKYNLPQFNGLRFKGEENGSHKLSDRKVRLIKRIGSMSPKMKRCEIARVFNVTPSLISNILNGKSWSHIKL